MPAKSLFGGRRPPFPLGRPRRDPGHAVPAQMGRRLAGQEGKLLYLVDAALTPASPVTDAGELTTLASAAVAAGRGHVLEASHVIFPNGAITLVLILAESHLAIHTWPEENLIAIDLFSCGAIDGNQVTGELARLLRLADVHVQRVDRGPAAAGPGRA